MVKSLSTKVDNVEKIRQCKFVFFLKEIAYTCIELQCVLKMVMIRSITKGWGEERKNRSAEDF